LPGMLSKRTTQALVAQGIEHRFPNLDPLRRALLTGRVEHWQAGGIARKASLEGHSSMIMGYFLITL
jgi:hypothetical protein